MSLNFYHSLLEILNAPDAGFSVGSSYSRRYRERPINSLHSTVESEKEAFDGKYPGFTWGR